MRELVVNAFLTLDGVMQAPGGPDEDPTGGFTHGGWAVEYWDDSTHGRRDRGYRRGGGVEYGSFTFEEPEEAELARREKLAGG